MSALQRCKFLGWFMGRMTALVYTAVGQCGPVWQVGLYQCHGDLKGFEREA